MSGFNQTVGTPPLAATRKIASPGAGEFDARAHITDRDRRAATKVETFQFVAGDERQRAAIWRPEHRAAAVSAGNRRGVERGDVPHPETKDARRVERRKGDARPVRGDGETGHLGALEKVIARRR